MNDRIISVHDDETIAKQARAALEKAGVSGSDIQILTPDNMRDGQTRQQNGDQSFGETLSSMFGSLFGSDDTKELGPRYMEAIRRGNSVLVVDTDDAAEAERVEQLLVSFDSVSIDERGAAWEADGWDRYDDNAPVFGDAEIKAERDSYSRHDMNAGAAETLTETEEQLKVGKNRDQAGKVKVFKRVIEEDAEVQVDLMDQNAVIRRREVNRPLEAGDSTAFKESAVEVEEFSEEAVVEKKARVTGEVDVGVETDTRTETISDTVRKSTVEVDDSKGTTKRTEGA